MATKFPIETDKPVIEVTLPVGRHVLELVVEDSAGLRSAPDTVIITVQKSETVAVAIAPTAVSLSPGKQQQFTATVTGSSNTAVTWSVLEPAGGTVSASGLYTAPSSDGTYHVRATSVADPTQRADAVITVKSAAVSVSISPATATLNTGGTQQFTATVTGATNLSVTWSVQERGGGAISTAGLYTAPATAGTYHVTATSVADTTKSATATVTVREISICTGATPTIICTSGAPTVLCTAGSPSVACTGATPTVIACTGSTPQIVTCAAGAPTSTTVCTGATPTVIACTGSTPTIIDCVAGAPTSTTVCTAATPQIVMCATGLPTIIRSAQDTEAEPAPAEKPVVKPKTKPKKK